MKSTLLAALALSLLSATAHAEEQTIAVPGEGWRIRFDAPKLKPTESSVPGIYAGVAGRLQLSFFAEKPRCSGPDTNENIYNCFIASMQENPTVVWETERGNTLKNGVQVTYLAEVKTEKGTVRALNVNLLFAHKGKWADVHVSMVSPKEADVDVLFDLIDSIAVEDEPVQKADG